VLYTNFEIFDLYTVTLKPGVTHVIENDAVRSSIYDFLLTFHSNHRPISHRFRDKRRFPTPCI